MSLMIVEAQTSAAVEILNAVVVFVVLLLAFEVGTAVAVALLFAVEADGEEPRRPRGAAKELLFVINPPVLPAKL